MPTEAPTIDFSEHRLGNGLRVLIAPDDTAPVAAVNLWYDVGSKHEQLGRTGLAHLFEHMMFEGSANVAKGEHFKLIQSAGGSLNATTWFHRTNYFESGPSNQTELYLWLEADRMGTLADALTQHTLDNQRDVVKNERRQRYEDAPYGTSWLELVARLFPEGHPYHHPTIGSMEDLSAVTVEDCRDFFRTYYAPNNAALTVAGDVERDSVLSWVETFFAPIPSATIPPPPDPAIGLGIGGPVLETFAERVPLPRVYHAFRAPGTGTREWTAMEVALSVLDFGGGPRGTRLYRRLVREQIAQDVATFGQDLAGCSIAVAQATARPGVAIEDLEVRLAAQLEGLATDPPADDEMERVRAQMERAWISSYMQRAAARANLLGEHATIFGDPARANERLPELLSITSAEIAAVAAEVFRADNRVTLLYVPEEK